MPGRIEQGTMNRALWKLGGVIAGYGALRAAVAYARRYDFAGRTIVITGGARGLGLVLARQLADEEAQLAICSRHEDQLQRAAHELRGRGARVVAHTCELTKPDQLAAFFDYVHRELGAVDVLINNAGVIEVGPLDTMTEDDFERALAIHLWAPMRGIEQVLPEMRRRGSGRIVNISSFGGRVAVPHLAPYCTSKFALVGLSQSYRAELAKDGVYVTTVCPGLMRTGSHVNAQFKGRHRAEYTWFSLGATLPFPAMSAERAARQIIRACRYGRAHATLSWPARMAEAAAIAAPEFVADAAGVVARWLPTAEGATSVGERAVSGQQSASRWSPSLATLLGERAALRNNEIESERLAPP